MNARDYQYAEWELKEFLFTVIKSCICVCALAYFFYKRIMAVIPLAFIGVMFFRKKTNEKILKDKKILEEQFCEAIRSVQTALKAGYSVENAFIQSKADMEKQYGKESYIYKELEVIRCGLVINITLEELLSDLARRSGSEVISDFAKVFVIAKRFGGNMTEVISSSVRTVRLRIETREEIDASLSGRKMELSIMKIMPFGILTYVGLSSPGYFDPLYEGINGMVIMSVLLAIYLSAVYLGDKMIAKLEEG